MGASEHRDSACNRWCVRRTSPTRSSREGRRKGLDNRLSLCRLRQSHAAAPHCRGISRCFPPILGRPITNRPATFAAAASRYKILYTGTSVREERELRWVSSSYRDLLAFPRDARRTAGFELGKVQAGLEPQDWKPLDVIGAGAREIRIRDVDGIFRVIYVAKFEEAVYVLHCFQKKTQATSTHDKAIAEARYRSVVNARKTSNESRR